MGVIVLGLYAEGRTDERFLPIIIRRTSEMILAQHGRVDVETWEPIIIRKGFAVSDRSEYILRAAREAVGYDVLIVHSDADDCTHSQTKRLLFDPGYMRIQQDNGPLCKNLVPIIPIRMVEAWMLADSEALQGVLKTTISIQTLMPKKAKLVEAERDPKWLIDQMIQRAYPHKPGQWSRIKGILYEDLASLVSLEKLGRLLAYQQFVQDFTEALMNLNIIQRR